MSGQLAESLSIDSFGIISDLILILCINKQQDRAALYHSTHIIYNGINISAHFLLLCYIFM